MAGMTNEGTLDLGNIEQVVSNLERMRSMMEAADQQHKARSLEFTERRMDEQKPGGPRAYILAHQLIGTAAENYSSVFWLFKGAEGATPVAPFNLIRPAFEAALHALWILDSHDPRQRCLRGLRQAHDDNKQKRRWNDEMMKLPFLTPDQRDELRTNTRDAEITYRGDALALGVPYSQVAEPFDTPREIPRLSFVKVDQERILGPMLLASWRQLSGYQHGLMYAILGGSSYKVEADLLGGAQARITVNDSSLSMALQAAGLLQMWAMNTYIRRCRQASRPVS